MTPSATGAPVQSGVSARYCLSCQYWSTCKYMQIRTCKYDSSEKLDNSSVTFPSNRSWPAARCTGFSGRSASLSVLSRFLVELCRGSTIIVLPSVTWRKGTWRTWRRNRVQEVSWITLARMKRTSHHSTARGNHHHIVEVVLRVWGVGIEPEPKRARSWQI